MDAFILYVNGRLEYDAADLDALGVPGPTKEFLLRHGLPRLHPDRLLLVTFEPKFYLTPDNRIVVGKQDMCDDLPIVVDPQDGCVYTSGEGEMAYLNSGVDMFVWFLSKTALFFEGGEPARNAQFNNLNKFFCEADGNALGRGTFWSIILEQIEDGLLG
ncbi:MAG: SUKH-4 family immunity protein [Micrococcales bacterium]|nr:SUKH-4 family immunity protein [Micrococcales bacterium]MCL2668734.1 SUKH-4 family immunity protein [Micrococcales bacterium]